MKIFCLPSRYSFLFTFSDLFESNLPCYPGIILFTNIFISYNPRLYNRIELLRRISFFEEPDLSQPLMQSQLKVNSFQIVIELCNLYTADIQFSKSHFKVTSQHHTFAVNIHTIWLFVYVEKQLSTSATQISKPSQKFAEMSTILLYYTSATLLK